MFSILLFVFSNSYWTDISEAHHFVVTLMSEPNDDDMSAEPLFVTIKDDFIIEKNFTGKVSDENSQINDRKQDWIVMFDQCSFLNRGTWIVLC